ncbi:MAG: polysaccharide deacetylase family protein [Halobacteriota archaeon]
MSTKRCSVACPGVFDDYEFAVCLTHDVDRVYKTYQSVYYALSERRLYHLETLFSNSEPYWQFEDIMALEDRLGVRSSFYFLNEKHLLSDKSPTAWLRPINWIRYTGHYDVTEPSVVSTIQALDEGGWEVGLHGSFDSYADPDRLAWEKQELEEVLGHPITGGRQHFLNLEGSETWQHHREAGLQYDTSFGSSSTVGFDTPAPVTGIEHGQSAATVPDRVGTGVFRPFDDDFLVFPLTVMEVPLVEESGSVDSAWEELQRLLTEARDRQAVVTVLWHPRLFNDAEFPGYRWLYEQLITEAKSLGAWVGPVEEAYHELVDHRRCSDT